VSARLRLFVALDLSANARAALARFRDGATGDSKAWRPVGDASLHVTLAFLGHRPEQDAGVVSGVLAGLTDRPPVRLRVGAVLLLPPRRPRVLAVSVADDGDDDGGGELAALHSELGAALVDADVYTPEVRAFRPHVTVARLRSGARAPRRISAAPEPVSFVAGTVTLYESRLGRGGAVYAPLAARSLG